MYLVIRKFNHMRSPTEGARRAEIGSGQLLKQSPGSKATMCLMLGMGLAGP
jgi:hypothetical protein